jgi:hypothetical protein
LRGKVFGDKRRIDGAGFQGPADDSHLTEGGDDQFVFIRVQTQLLEYEHRRSCDESSKHDVEKVNP